MKINQLYKSIAESVGLKADKQGLLSLEIGDQVKPAMLDKKRLVLPTDEILRLGDWEQFIAFHPICENIMRAESIVLQRIRTLAVMRIHAAISFLTTGLLEVAVDTAGHSKLEANANEFLTHVTNADAKLAAAWERVIESSRITGDKQLVSIYLKRKGKWKAATFHRVAVTRFPIFDAIKEGQDGTGTIFGIKFRKKDFKTLESLFEYILPDIDDDDGYCYGSNSNTAPYFHALMNSYAKVIERINIIAKRFRKQLGEEMYEAIHIEDEWVANFSLEAYNNVIPVLPGSEGAPVNGRDEPTPAAKLASTTAAALMEQDEAVTTTLKQQVTAPVEQAVASPFNPNPAPAPTVTEEVDEGALDWTEVVARRAAANARNAAAPVQNAFNQPVQNVFNPTPVQQTFAPVQQVAAAPGGYAGQPSFGQVNQPMAFGTPQQAPGTVPQGGFAWAQQQPAYGL